MSERDASGATAAEDREEPAAAAPDTGSLPDCRIPCNDLAEAICEACESPVKGRDCVGWAECLAEADKDVLPCRFCEPVVDRAVLGSLNREARACREHTRRLDAFLREDERLGAR